MFCDACKKHEATVHLTQILDGKMQTIDLCEACSKAKGVDDPTGFSLASLLIGVGNTPEKVETPPPAPTELRCVRCGFTLTDFKKAGRLGCAGCYLTFTEALHSLLKTMHKGSKHVGKNPHTIKKTLDSAEKLRQLQNQLDEAIKIEDFERAAQLRDEIKQLRNPTSQPPVKSV